MPRPEFLGQRENAACPSGDRTLVERFWANESVNPTHLQLRDHVRRAQESKFQVTHRIYPTGDKEITQQ
jgi:hypothetical protein